MKKDKIIIYTDGAARGNPGKAGWAAIIINYELRITNPKIIELGGSSSYATNNQMELSGPIGALKYLHLNSARQGLAHDVEIFSDSKYVILGITEWIFNWQKNNWRNAAKKSVLNKELWVELYELSREFKIKWTYVEGHSGDKYNERADEIATNFADGNKIELKNER
ncbi:MAG: Ribonuclease H [Candidatus Nomurabacteria bacterium GW2011_GWE1_32_28]|uniref:Ribonuclease H n=1 Tax=Candidatus Nomurabacteria bacterium GW2011_GWF1_31_48 TaxID=1618767 RepID=A0A0G0ATM9_9BACT|nr:MAG: Ribonuclease H [Candidatus Nomurabacteria bacterium GW2011_GWF2_30_133]KKP28430.1 MAG: Ribonuclease H [Candidatus Nomurabacteria bacterium GW2011_GWE2_31_40]KKP30010.1 MAG: Ribonuclease H [Candidatus Nomurabacteria bacterium GW2011_GWF1_31_48]KKP34529.1 MAG: Ribonuclease H [Candidatus Nomurabacteria bacterium GW2011_GWE1_32_28]HAS81072.1 ribonuclease HI [Candidatus Nomurabacteria bacterium]